MVSSTLLTLIVIPAIFALVESARMRVRRRRPAILAESVA
jgi:Cu/Ag efflux pump CusA